MPPVSRLFRFYPDPAVTSCLISNSVLVAATGAASARLCCSLWSEPACSPSTPVWTGSRLILIGVFLKTCAPLSGQAWIWRSVDRGQTCVISARLPMIRRLRNRPDLPPQTPRKVPKQNRYYRHRRESPRARQLSARVAQTARRRICSPSDPDWIVRGRICGELFEVSAKYCGLTGRALPNGLVCFAWPLQR